MNKTRYSATEFGRNKPMSFRPSGTLKDKYLEIRLHKTSSLFFQTQAQDSVTGNFEPIKAHHFFMPS